MLFLSLRLSETNSHGRLDSDVVLLTLRLLNSASNLSEGKCVDISSLNPGLGIDVICYLCYISHEFAFLTYPNRLETKMPFRQFYEIPEAETS